MKLNRKNLLYSSLLAFILLYTSAIYGAASRDDYKAEESLANIDQSKFYTLLGEQLGNKPYPLPNLADKEIILVLGETGVGKSAIINRILGHQFDFIPCKKRDIGKKSYKKKEKKVKSTKHKPPINKNAILPQPGLEELLDQSSDDENSVEKVLAIVKKKPNTLIAPMGKDDVSSCTKVPQAYGLVGNILLVDCPGFDDSDGIEQEVLNLLMIRLFVEKAAKVNALLVLFPYSVLTDGGKGQHLLTLAKQLDYLVNFTQCTSNVFWCFTRCPKNTKRKSIEKKIAALRAKKASFKVQQRLWAQSEQKQDMELLDAMLKEKNRVRVVSPLWQEDKVNKMKNILKAIGKNAIAKKHFDFYHPTLDIKSIAKNLFEYKIAQIKIENEDLISLYKKYEPIAIEIAEKKQKFKELLSIVSDHTKLANYIKSGQAIKEALNKVEKAKQIVQKIAHDLEQMTNAKQEKELVLYRSEHLNLSARWLSDSKVITYNDLPFDDKSLQEIYLKEIKRTSITYAPDSGSYKVKFEVPGSWCNITLGSALGGTTAAAFMIASGGTVTPLVTFLMGTAGGYAFTAKNTAAVNVHFYVEKKEIQKKAIKRKQKELVEEKAKLTTEELNLQCLKKDQEAQIKKQVSELPNVINALSTQNALLEKTLQNQLVFIYFIGEVYPFLYHVDDEINSFAKDWKERFKLFASPGVVSGNNDENDEKKYDDDDSDEGNERNLKIVEADNGIVYIKQ